MKTGIWGAVGLAVVLSFWGCSGSDTSVLEGGTGGVAAKSGGAAAKSGGAAPAAGGALSSGGTGGMLPATCPAVEPTGNLLNCSGTASGTSCPYAVNLCTCIRNVWACQNPLCPDALPKTGGACLGVENANCRYPRRNVCDCKAGAWKCFQTQSQSCPPQPPANGTACPALGGTFCDYELLMSSLDVGSAGAAGAAGAGNAAGANAAGSSSGGVPTAAGGGVPTTSGGAASGGAGNTAGAAGASTPLACGCSPQNQKWYCF